MRGERGVPEYVVSCKNLGCKSGRNYLLKDVNWNVKPGEHWVVFGLNGSGKTTLLTIITGVKKFTHGSVEVFGAPYNENTILINRQRIGLVSSSFYDRYYHKEQVLMIILSGLTGTLNVDYRITEQDVLKAKMLLDQFGILHKMGMPFDYLSKGERQCVLLARALIADPDILILDEPGTGLDVLAREKLFQMINHITRDEKKTIIYVTHYPEEITENFDKCILLKNGRVYRQGEIKTLFTSEMISDFLGKKINLEKDNEGKMHINLL